MNPAVPIGRPSSSLIDEKMLKIPAPTSLGKTMRRGILIKINFSPIFRVLV